MVYKSNAEIALLFKGLLTRTLPKADWTHAAHFAAAMAMVSDDNYDAVQDMPGLIRAYNEATGVQNTDSDGYHHTITLASLMAAQHVLTRSAALPLYQSVNQLLASKYGRSDWLLSYWTSECLFSVKARQIWVGPDIKNLPFPTDFS